MIELRRLQMMGAISAALAVVDLSSRDMIDAEEAASLSDAEQAKEKRVVTVSNPGWIATTKGRNPKESMSVYSCNANDEIGVWDARSRRFQLMRLNGNSLYTEKQIKLKKEDLNMADANKMLADALNDANGQVEKMDSFGSLNGSSESAKGTKAPKESEIAADAIKKAVGSKSISDNSANVMNNRKNGRLIAFITATNDAIKVSKKSKPVEDANGKRVIDEQKRADYEANHPEQYKKILAGDIKPPVSICQKENYVEFVNAKPGKILGVIVETPAGSDRNLTDINLGKVLDKGDSQDLVVRILSTELAYPYLAFNYGDQILESEQIVGPAATKVLVKHDPKIVTDKNGGPEKRELRSKFVVEKKDSIRKATLIDGNYFPVQTFKTLDLTNIDAAKAKQLNLNFEAAFKAPGSYDSMNEVTKSLIRPTGDGYESEYFNNGEQIKVVRYDALNGETVSDVRIPLREKKQSKKGDSFTYKFVKTQIDDTDGSANNDKYAKIIAATKLSKEAFIDEIKKVTARRKSGSKTKADLIDTNTYLKSLDSDIYSGTTKDLIQLQSEIDGL